MLILGLGSLRVGMGATLSTASVQLSQRCMPSEVLPSIGCVLDPGWHKPRCAASLIACGVVQGENQALRPYSRRAPLAATRFDCAW